MLYPREILTRAKKVFDRDEFIIFTGARQTGKTSLLLMLKSWLEKKGENGHYLNLENTEYLGAFNRRPENIFEYLPGAEKKQYVFIDEIQYLDDPTNFLKYLFDEKREKIKIIASGSSSFYIDKKFRDSLAGRKFLFEIRTLNFDEFLVFKNQKELLAQKSKKITAYYKKKLDELWEEYLIFGGYPKVVLAEDNELKKILLEEIGSSYIKKDITDAGIRNSEKYLKLLKILAAQSGQLANAQELAATMGLARKTLNEYLYVAEKSYQVAFISPFYRNIRKELTKMPKVFFYDLGLRNFFLGDFSPLKKRADKGQYLENAAFREFLNIAKNTDEIKFWRTQDKKEVDFVIGGKEAYEIKFSARKVDRKKYEKFTKKYPEVKLNFLDEKDILEKFYGFKIG